MSRRVEFVPQSRAATLFFIVQLHISQGHAPKGQLLNGPRTNGINAVGEVGGQVRVETLHPGPRAGNPTRGLRAGTCELESCRTLSRSSFVRLSHGQSVYFTFGLANSTIGFELAHRVAKFNVNEPIPRGHWSTISQERSVLNHHNSAGATANCDDEVPFWSSAEQFSDGFNLGR
jgi:hypothetical protein